MVDPFSAGALGAVAVVEGIRFVYNQAGEVLKRRRERREAARAGTPPPAEPIVVEEASVLRGRLAPVEIDDRAADELAGELKALRARLNDYATGVDVPDDDDTDAIASMRALRDALESIIGQRITFTFDQDDRAASGAPVLTGTVTAAQIRGRVTGLEAADVAAGELRGHVEAGTVEAGADVAGLRARNIGVPPPRRSPP